jgi:hypothetical protein
MKKFIRLFSFVVGTHHARVLPRVHPACRGEA